VLGERNKKTYKREEYNMFEFCRDLIHVGLMSCAYLLILTYLDVDVSVNLFYASVGILFVGATLQYKYI